MTEFRAVSYAQEVIFGPGSLTRLGEAVAPLACRRLMLCTNPSVRASESFTFVEAALREHLVAVFDHVVAHVQDVQLKEALEFAIECQVDGVIGMGGGSPIGMAKAIGFELGKIRVDQVPIPVIAIPTTYAGSEMTPIFGVTHTDETPARKVTINDARITPRLVIYDPEITLNLPPELTASSGINALAHCIEALYSITRHPLSTAAAIRGVRHISNSLLRCYVDGVDLDARTEMLLGSYLAGFSLASVSMGLHHGLCHILGGSAGVPHGIANSILLPHVIRFNAEVAASQLLPAVEAMGIYTIGASPAACMEEMEKRILDLTGEMNLPQRLRDAGVKENDLPKLAQLGFQNRNVQNNPRPIVDAAQIERLLKDAL
jgi:maleylacetate reductase